MEIKHIMPLCGKKVQFKSKDGFYTTTTLPNVIDSDVITIKDKFGNTMILDISTIEMIREVSQ